MIGAIAGDIIGSVYEGYPLKSEEFPLFQNDSVFTDDSVLTIALADAVLNGIKYVEAFQRWGRKYPDAGYGGNFYQWIFSESPKPYNSWGNGAAMRVSPIGFAYNDIEQVLLEAKKTAAVSHNHPEGIKGAQSVAAAVCIARRNKNKNAVKEFIEQKFGYNLGRTIEEIRPNYSFDVSCQGSVPEAIIAFLESSDWEDAVRKSVSLGGDSDTQGCITGAIAEAYYENIAEDITKEVYNRITPEMKKILADFEKTYN